MTSLVDQPQPAPTPSHDRVAHVQAQFRARRRSSAIGGVPRRRRSSDPPTTAILVTGATGRQGGAVVDALLALHNPDLLILALTRDPESYAAQRLAAKSPSIKFVKGDLSDVEGIFTAAEAAAPTRKITGVFLVQPALPFSSTAAEGSDGPRMHGSVPGPLDSVESCPEVERGRALIDAAIAHDVKMFVYSSVDRGGDKSWDNPTPVPHFRTKYVIEHHLRDAADAAGMKWTILRPVMLLDNLELGFPTKLFLTLLRDTVGDKPMPWVAAADVGVFAAKAFELQDTYNRAAISLAGDDLTWDQMQETFTAVTGDPLPTTYSLVSKAFMYAAREVRATVEWYRNEGYHADIAKLRAIHPDLMDFATWLREKSTFTHGE